MAEQKKGFDLAAALGSVSNLNAGAEGREQIEYIERKRIQADKRNFYALDGVKELAANIQFVGLQQPIRLRPDDKLGGMYRIVSGHRRFAAIKLLAKDEPQRWERIPCIVEHVQVEGEVAELLQELRLIYGNSDTRKMSSADISKQAERVEMLLYQLKEAGVEFPGKMRDHVAQACKVSAPKLARLKVIREGLIPDYKTEWEKGKLGESAAYAVARFPADFQARLYKVLANLPGHVGNAEPLERVLKKFVEGWDWTPCMTCPDGKTCKRGDTFLRRDCGAYSYQTICGGRTCCLKCPEAKREYGPCEQMCSKAKAERQGKRDAEKEAAEKRAEKEARKVQKETQRNAERLMAAIEAAGLGDGVGVPWGYERYEVKVIREWSQGVFGDCKNWWGAKLTPQRCTEPVRTAKVLKCSTDWLLGLTDELTPTVPPVPEQAPEDPGPAAASSEDPPACLAGPPTDSGQWVLLEWISPARKPENGQMVALEFDFGGAGKGYQLGRWVDGEWCFASSGTTMSSQPTGWFPLPADTKGDVTDDQGSDNGL